MADFLPPDEQRLYDTTVHNLRMRGWERIDAENRAIDLVVLCRELQSKEATRRPTKRGITQRPIADDPPASPQERDRSHGT